MSEQMASSGEDVLHALLLEGSERLLLIEDLTEAEDGVERRAQFMAHTGKELRFGTIGCVGLILGLEEPIAFLFCPLLFGDIYADADTTPTSRSQCFDTHHFIQPAPFAIGSQTTVLICVTLLTAP